MTEAEWLKCEHAESMLGCRWMHRRDRKRRLFAVACCHRVLRLITDERARRALEAAEAMADQADGIERWEHWNEMQDVLAEFDVRREADLDYRESIPRGTREALEAVSEVTHPSIARVAERGALLTGLADRWQDWAVVKRAQADLLREIFGNPFHPVAFSPSWITSDVLLLSRGIYEERAFDRMPILADALQDAGCTNEHLLTHLRDPNATHIRGCWALDLILGKS
jgi:hypothetical protein